MNQWIPDSEWKDREVFVIGGGASLERFNFNLLIPELTIGCNDAYKKGKDICKICIFGDYAWFKVHQSRLALCAGNEAGRVVTNCPRLQNSKIPWLTFIPRKSKGLHFNELGWNHNTGASAINLALILGAKRIYLLGFDMKLINGKANWYKNEVNKTIKPEQIIRFKEGFINVFIDLKQKFPDREVINLTDNSDLNVFPKMSFLKFWQNRIQEKERIVI